DENTPNEYNAILDGIERNVIYYGNLELTGQQYINLDKSGANVPELATGMIPVYYDDASGTWKKADSSNIDKANKWYDYNNKMWANAVTVTEKGYSASSVENNKIVNIENEITTKFTSSNKGINNSTSSSVFTFTAGSDGNYSFHWSVSSESDYDKLTITINGITLNDVNAVSGVKSGTYIGTARSGTTYTIIASYKKDGSTAENDDIATISNFVLPSGSTNITHTANSSYPDYQWISVEANIASSSYTIDNGNFVLGELISGDITNKYMCSDGVSTTCDTLYLVKKVTNNLVTKVDVYNVLVKTREFYQNVEVGTEISMDDINTMWVWIPRFMATGDTANYNGGTQANPGAFNITFVDKKTTAHNAFTFGTQELNGFWVGKFQTSHNTLSSCTEYDNLGCTNDTCSNANGIIIKPNVKLLSCNNISNVFYASLSMKQSSNSFGFNKTKDITLDTHMMKNNEWGAVAYLTQSIYGRCSSSTSCTEVGINNNSGYITGYGSPAGSSECDISYKYNENKIEESLAEGTGTNVSTTITNDVTYPWVNTNGVWSSSNNGQNSTTSSLIFSFTLSSKGVVSFDYSVSSRACNDEMSYVINNGTKDVIKGDAISGTTRGTTEANIVYDNKAHVLDAGTYTLTFTYSKDDQSAFGLDKGYIKNVKVLVGAKTITKEVSGGQLASTTGNVSGIYDMSGGLAEYVMGNYNNTIGDAGFSNLPDTKYYNSYTNTGTEENPITNYTSDMQHALTETAGWYDDEVYFVSGSIPWFIRGGYWNGIEYSGVFAYGTYDGFGYSDSGSRFSLIIN
ncbi:MAG: hypothetical protein ACI4P7_00190, partial [Bacilli bacterium]